MFTNNYSHGILMKHVSIPGYCKNTKARVSKQKTVHFGKYDHT